jgi:hypothetical protein
VVVGPRGGVILVRGHTEIIPTPAPAGHWR